jgi:choline monooxygenase
MFMINSFRRDMISKLRHYKNNVHNPYFTKSFYKDTIDNPTSKALTIHPSVYSNPFFFNIEKDIIFRRNWIPIGCINDYNIEKSPNMYSKKIIDIPIIISNINNNFKGYYNVCRHRGCKLLDKDKYSKSGILSCPYHNWSYDTSKEGKLMKCYLYDNKDIDINDYSLYPIKLGIHNNLLFCNLSPNNEIVDLEKYYGYAFKELDNYPLYKKDTYKIVKKGYYDINANWKLLIDNFIEYYHLPKVHPKLVRNSKMESHICTQGNGHYIGFKTEPLTSSGLPIDVEKSPLFWGLNESYRNRATFHSLFPNMFYFLFPNHMFIVIVNPISPTKSREEAILITDKNADKEWIEDLWKFYDEVNREDINICEKVQEGLGCKIYNGGRMIEKYEKTIHRFHKMLIKKILE